MCFEPEQDGGGDLSVLKLVGFMLPWIKFTTSTFKSTVLVQFTHKYK